MTKPVYATELPATTDNPFPKAFHQQMGQAAVRALGDHFGLCDFGVNLEVLKPEGSSGLSHWHTKSQEFVYVLNGELTLYYGDEIHQLSAGMCMGFQANENKGHRLVNHTDSEASFMVIGSRVDGDNVSYDKDDFSWQVQANGDWLPAHKDGTLYEPE